MRAVGFATEKRPWKKDGGKPPGPWSAATAGQERKETLAYNQATAISLWELSVCDVLAGQRVRCIGPGSFKCFKRVGVHQNIVQ